MNSSLFSPYPFLPMLLSISRSAGALLVGALLFAASPAQAQSTSTGTRRLSLEEAIRTAESQSSTINIARAGVARAGGQELQASSQYLPQVNANAGYTKTLKSQFQGLSFGGSDTGAAKNTVSSLQSVGFGAANEYLVGVQVSQNVLTFGRLPGQRTTAQAGRRVADIELSAQRAQLALDVTQAYYDAVLADRLVAIAESTLAQTDELLRQTKVARQVGNESEFDLLKAQVTRDNQVPILLQARTNSDVSLLRVKQLLEISLDEPVELTTKIEDSPTEGFAGIATASEPDTSADHRATVRQALENVRAQEGQLQVARSERYPAFSLTSGYQRLFFPAGTLPAWNDFRQNWTVGIAAQMPVFTGGHTHGDEMIAEAGVREARARAQQARQGASLDSRIALQQLAQADAAWKASAGTADQAQRAYSIDQIRYAEGISTQTDLAQSRLLLEQANVNRAQAARDLAVARARLALLRDLPLPQTGGSASGGSTPGATSQQQSQPQPPRPAQATAGTPGQTGSVVP
jgi:outer membrane protein